MSLPAALENLTSPDDDEGMLTADGFDEAILGVVRRCGQKPFVLYDRDLCIAILMSRDGMSEEAAHEFFDFNVEGAWMGEGSPGYLHRPEN